jgi:hypothetical protein
MFINAATVVYWLRGLSVFAWNLPWLMWVVHHFLVYVCVANSCHTDLKNLCLSMVGIFLC